MIKVFIQSEIEEIASSVDLQFLDECSVKYTIHQGWIKIPPQKCTLPYQVGIKLVYTLEHYITTEPKVVFAMEYISVYLDNRG